MKKIFFSTLAISLVLTQTLSANLEKKFIEKHQIIGESDELKRVVVELEHDANRNEVLQKIVQLQNTELRRNFNSVISGFSFEVPSKFISKISSIKGVKSIREAVAYTPLAYKSQEMTQSLLAKQNYANKGEGMVISIIDTGVDTKHQDMQMIQNPDKAKLKVSTESSDFTVKVPYGYNFSDNSYNFKDDTDKTMHGMHVAGIAAASGNYDESNPESSLTGVAPEAQILAMKVFTNSPTNKLAYDDDILAAIEKSIELKADIINLSLGSPNGFVDGESPVQKAINYAQSQGILVVAAAGNETTSVSEDDGTASIKNMIERDRYDFGIVGSPSVADGALSVASYENQLVLKNKGTLSHNNQVLHTISFNPSKGSIDDVEREIVYAGYGKEEDYDFINVRNKYVLVERGEIYFTTKVNNAMYSGAKGIIIFNNRAGTFNMDLEGSEDGLVIGISQEEGQRLLELIRNNPGATLKLNPNKEYAQNEEANLMSSFTSWGTTNTLDFKPEITGIGGNVLSTLNDNQYKYDSGTSMAAPHVSGASAIIYSQLKKDLPTIDNYAEFTKKTILNTAKVLVNPNQIAYTPRRQGAGLIQTNDAIRNRVLITYESEDGESVGELRDFTTTKQFNVVLKNYGNNMVSFDINPNQVQTTKTIQNGESFEIVEQYSNATLISDFNNISLAPNETKTIPFTLNAQNVSEEYVEGFIRFTSKTIDQPDLNFAYFGFAGDWNKESIFDPIYSEENKDSVNKVYGFTRLVTQLGEVYIPAGVSANSGERAAYSYENASISPNNDTAADVILPQFATLRNTERLEFNILDANKNVIRHLVDERKVAKLSVKRFKANVSSNEQFLVPAYLNAKWDGTIYDTQSGTLKSVQDGTYYYQVKAYLRNQDEPQILEYKVVVDTVQPVINIESITQSEVGVTIRYRVDENLALVYNYARLNTDGDQISAQKVGDNLYEVVLSNKAINNDLVELVVKDAAYNETVLKMDQVQTARFEKGEQSKLVEAMDEKVRLALNLKDDSVSKVRVTYTNILDENIKIVDEKEVVNRFVEIESTLVEEGKYKTTVEEIVGSDVISKIDLDNVVFDSQAPVLSNVVALRNGKITAIIQDNIFAANELLYYINDTLVEPAFMGNNITIQNPNVQVGDQLTVAHKKGEEKGLSITINLDYINGPTGPIDPPPPPPLPPLGNKKVNLIFNNFLSAGIKDLQTTENPTGTIVERDGKFYYTLKGSTNDVWSDIYVNGVQADMNYRNSEFTSEIEIKEGINTINVVSKDYTNKIVFEGNVKIFFDKQLPVLNWNQNLQFEVDQDKTYIVVDDKTQELILSGRLQDQGFGYGLEINGDYVVSKTEIAKQLTYDIEFNKTIKVNQDDIVTVVVVDAVGNKEEFKYYIKKVKVYDDLNLTKQITKPEYEKVTISDVISNIPDGYTVEFVEKVDNLSTGTHKVNVVVTYPDQKKKSFEIEITITENKKVELNKDDVIVSGTQKELGISNRLYVETMTEVKDDVVEDTFNLRLDNPLNGEVYVTLPINKVGFKELYFMKDGKKIVIDTQVENNAIRFKVNELSPFVISYVKQSIEFISNGVKIKTNDLTNDLIFKAKLILSSENYDVFELGFYNQFDEKVEVKTGKYVVTLPKKEGRNVVNVSYDNHLGNKEEFRFTQDDKTVTFETTHFSQYTITYEPVSTTTSKLVNTSDTQNNLLWISLIVLSGFVLLNVKSRKNRR